MITIGFTAILQANLSRSDTESLLKLNISDVENDIVDASDANLLALTRLAAQDLRKAYNATDEKWVQVAEELDVAEINVVDRNGIIVASTQPEFVGFDMASGEQSAAFLELLPRSGPMQLVQSYQPISYDENMWRKYAGKKIIGGFVQVGYDAQNFVGDLFSQINTSVKNRHVGQTGELIVIDEEGSVIGTRDGIEDQEADHLIADASVFAPNTLFATTFAGKDYYAEYDVVEGYRVIALLPKAEAEFSSNVSVLIMSFMEVIVFAALFLIIYFTIKRIVVRSIWNTESSTICWRAWYIAIYGTDTIVMNVVAIEHRNTKRHASIRSGGITSQWRTA